MEIFNFDTKQATPEWVTKILMKNGFLTQGEVSSVEQAVPKLANAVLVSTFLSLNLKYSADSLGLKPSSVLLKAINQEFLEHEGQKELKFYTSILDSQESLPLLTCYGTEICPKTNQYCLLLEDLTLTHHQTPFPLPPLQEQCESAVKTLAKVHAFWWNHPLFGKEVFKRPTEKRLLNHYEQHANYYQKFSDYLGDRLPENRRKVYQMVFQKLPNILWDLLSMEDKQTLAHGDAHFWNFLFPNDNDKDKCIILDWQSWGVGLGASDLAYMMTIQWYPERRRRMEIRLLKLYLKELNKQGINYTWDELLTAYRVYAIVNLLIPVWQYQVRFPPILWWNHLERGFASFEDLNCLELL